MIGFIYSLLFLYLWAFCDVDGVDDAHDYDDDDDDRLGFPILRGGAHLLVGSIWNWLVRLYDDGGRVRVHDDHVRSLPNSNSVN